MSDSRDWWRAPPGGHITSQLRHQLANVRVTRRRQLLTCRRGRLPSCRVLWKHSRPATDLSPRFGNQTCTWRVGKTFKLHKNYEPFWWGWFWSVSRGEALGDEEEEEGWSWTDRSSPAERAAPPDASFDSPVCSFAERPGNAQRRERTGGWA